MLSDENGNKGQCPVVTGDDSGQYSITDHMVQCQTGSCQLPLTTLEPDSKYCVAVQALASDGSLGTATPPETVLTYPTSMYENFEGDVFYDETTGVGNWISTSFGNTETSYFQVWTGGSGSAYSGASFVAPWNQEQQYDNDESPVIITSKALNMSKMTKPGLIVAYQLKRPDLDWEDVGVWTNTDSGNADDCFIGMWTQHTRILNDDGINPTLDTEDWEHLFVDLTEFAGNANVCIGISIRSNSEGTDMGIIVDNIQLVQQPSFTRTLFQEHFPGGIDEFGEAQCDNDNVWHERGTFFKPDCAGPDGVIGTEDDGDDCTKWWRVVPGDDGNEDCKMWLTNPTFSIGQYGDGWLYDDTALQITYPFPSGTSDGSNGFFVSEGGWTTLSYSERYENLDPSTAGVVIRWSDSQIGDCYDSNLYIISTSIGDTFVDEFGLPALPERRTIDLSHFRGKYICSIFWFEDSSTTDGVVGAGWQIDEVYIERVL